MAGNAVGLGNFLRFPVQAIQNGGGAFIIPYLVCFLLMGIPLLWVEWAIGRMGGRHGYHATPFALQLLDPKRPGWKYAGVLGIFNCLAIATYYCYIESWTMSYIWHSVAGSFRGMDQEEVSLFFDRYLDVQQRGLFSPAVLAFIFCTLLNAWLLSRGLVKGIETVAKIGMPLLIIFGILLAYKGVTLKAGQDGAAFDGVAGLNFLWQPQFDSLLNPKVWLAAAGQIFFTISLGWGMVHCYASYISDRDDVALNAMAAGWTNEFVEVVLGSAILVPIAVGYFGIERAVELVSTGGLGLAFRTMPFLFGQWGAFVGLVAGVMFFGLLFFAAVTSSLAMGSPWIGFMQDEFRWSRPVGAWSFGLIVVVLGLPTVWYFQQGVFDEYDYWAGTVSLFLLALLEAILFCWIFGLTRGWAEINLGADIRLWPLYRFVLQYITPTLLLLVFFASLVQPLGSDWGGAFGSLLHGQGWPLDNDSMLGRLTHQGLQRQMAEAPIGTDLAPLDERRTLLNFSRGLLLAFFGFLCVLVKIASHRKKTLNHGRA